MIAVSSSKYTQTLVRMGDSAIVSFVFVLFFTSGFAALLYQVIWQRVLAIFSGADVYSVTIIVAAFMAGLGCGSLAGGYIADRVSMRRRIVLFAVSELAIAVFALISKWLYYDVLYLQFNHLARSPVVLAGVLFISLLWPTFFMGMSLPLLAKTLTRRVEGAAQMIGSLYAFNTLGAAVGALLTVWLFMRTLGFEVTVQFGAVLNIFAALGAVAVAPYFLRQAPEADDSHQEVESVESVQSKSETPLFPVSIWIAIYGVSGFVALSLEILWFRLLGVMVKSTAFTFGNLLAVFLAGLAIGTFWGIKWADRSKHPARIFLVLQAGITLYAATSVALLVSALGNLEIVQPLYAYFDKYDTVDIAGALESVGRYLSGQFLINVGPQTATFVSLYFVLPILLIGPPTLMMGLSFPFLQKVVQRDVAVLGRRVGWLQTANIFGSMLGAVSTGWLFLSLLGTASTLKMLLVFAGGFLVLLVYITYTRARRSGSSIRTVAVASGLIAVGILLLMWLVPGSSTMWAKLHGVTPDKIIQAEDGSGLALLKAADKDTTVVYVNGLGQSAIPFPLHHVVLGMVPVLMHPDQSRWRSSAWVGGLLYGALAGGLRLRR
jgi:predicted membrane-bound spermidine synthase